jgi:hypothetical protein
MVGSVLAVATTFALAAEPGALDVRGDADCPRPALVAARLRPLLAGGQELPAGTWLEVGDFPAEAGAPPSAEISLVRSGKWLASRRLAKAATCEETAEALAVVAATWTARYGAVPPAPLALPEPAREGGVPVVAVAPRPHDDGRGLALGVGAGAVAARAGTTGTLVGVEAMAQRTEHVRARLCVAGVGERTLALAPGSAAWRRLFASPGLAWAVGSPAASVEVGLGALVGVAFLEGRGFTQNDRTTSLDLGATPWLRASAGLAAAPVTFWAGASALAWARAQRVHVQGGAEGALPAFDLVLGGGVLWTLGAVRPP